MNRVPTKPPCGRRLAGTLLAAILALLPATTGVAAPASTVKVDAETEVLIRQALRYLAAEQAPNGCWPGRTDKERQYPIALTAYALMAFMAAGNLPDEGEFGRQVSLGMNHLLASISPDGLIGDRGSGHYMYWHGISTIVLAELYGQSNSAAVRPKLERLVKIIIAGQSPQGGWRYRPTSTDADISVTVLQVVALRAAKTSGLKVPRKTIDDAVAYVRKCYHEESGGFCYQPGQTPGFARTAAAIYSLQVCGEYDDPRVKTGSEYLFETFGEKRYFSYGNFYAAPAQYMIGGETWSKWYSMLRDHLHQRATVDGDRAHWSGASQVGPLFETSVNAMILAMPYQFIPLYQR
jgi:hypothetical protein